MKWSVALKDPNFVDKSPEEIRSVQSSYHEKKKSRKKKRKSKSIESWVARKHKASQNKKVKQDKIDIFYSSWDWKRLRYDYIKEKDRRCECCGAQPSNGIRIVVDHIKPIRHHWHLRLQKDNLQMLCDDCNMGKGSRDETDWRNGSADLHGSDDIVLSILRELAEKSN